MKKFLSFTKSSVRFRRFARKAYAAFRSMHLQISIGTTSRLFSDKALIKTGGLNTTLIFNNDFDGLSISDDDTPKETSPQEVLLIANAITSQSKRTLPAAIKLSAALCMCLCVNVSMAQDNDVKVELNEICIQGEKAEINSEKLRIITSINQEKLELYQGKPITELLKEMPGVDLRQRGAEGVQADISMRGGTFDQVMVLLNGLNLTDIQTGHYTLNIPVNIAYADKIEVLQGTAVNQFGLSAFGGAINIINKPLSNNGLNFKADFTTGSFGFLNPSAQIKYKKNDFFINASLNYSHSDGYIHNTDFDIYNLHLLCGIKNFTFQAGAQSKDCGANGFYSLKFADQYDKTKNFFTHLSYTKKISQIKIESSIYQRSTYDCFSLSPEYASNYHMTNTAGVNLKAGYYTSFGKTTVGAELRNENIASNVLGEPLTNYKDIPFGADTVFTFGKNRLNFNYFLEQSLYFNKLSISAGISGNSNSMFKNNISGCVNAGYEIYRNLNLYANFNHALRLPTFTELYYKSAVQIANPELKPEKAECFEVGIKSDKTPYKAGLSAFCRHGKNIIDWVKYPSDEKWKSLNHTVVDSYGFEIFFGYSGSDFIKDLNINYSFTDIYKDAGELMSKYADDCLKHKINLSVNLKPYKKINVLLNLKYCNRDGIYNDINGETVNYQPYTTADARVIYFMNKIKLFAECNNIFDEQYCDISGLIQPGIGFKAGISIEINR